MKKKGLVLAIVIAMLTSIIPSFAFATENNSSDEAITKAKERKIFAGRSRIQTGTCKISGS